MGKILVVLILVALVAGIGLTYSRWEFQPPAVSFDRDFNALGRAPALTVNVADASNPLKHVTIKLLQKEQEVVLVDEAPAETALVKIYDVGKLLVEKHKTQDGPASIIVTAQDTSLGNFFRGNRTEVTKEFTFD